MIFGRLALEEVTGVFNGSTQRIGLGEELSECLGRGRLGRVRAPALRTRIDPDRCGLVGFGVWPGWRALSVVRASCPDCERRRARACECCLLMVMRGYARPGSSGRACGGR